MRVNYVQKPLLTVRYGKQPDKGGWQPIEDRFERLLKQDTPNPADWKDLYQQVRQWSKQLQSKLSTQEAELLTLKENATTDPLTGLANRRFFDSELDRAFAQAQRDERPLSLILMDIDKLKTINDRFGHEGGDLMLTMLANALKDQVRRNERLSRIGGEEFALVLESTPSDFALAVAKRLNQRIGSLYRTHRWKQLLPKASSEQLALAEDILKTHGLTVSLGAATFTPEQDATRITDSKQLANMADTALYLCKGAPIRNPWLGQDAWKGLTETRNRVYTIGLNKAGKAHADLGFVGYTPEERGMQPA